MVSLGKPHHFKLFKDCLPQMLLAPFLNTLPDLVELLRRLFKQNLGSTAPGKFPYVNLYVWHFKVANIFELRSKLIMT